MTENISAQDFQIFKEAMIEDNLALQIDIIKKLVSLAKALGEKATREQLLPFIENNLYLHDELLLHLSDQLKSFIPLVGGVEHSQIVFDILTKICNTDENIVREGAVNALISIGNGLNAQQMKDFLMPVINKLVNDDWFTSKCSAVMLFASFYPKLSKKKKTELRNILKTLIQDDSPMVRKAAASACIDMVAILEDDIMKKEFIPMFCDISQDPMDTVKCISVDIALALAKKFDEENFEESIFKTLQTASEDPSWRLRQRLANNIANLQQHIPYGRYRGKLLAIFQKITQDIEPEVRVLAAGNMFEYCKHLAASYTSQPQYENNFEPIFEQSILPIIYRLAVDENEEVRLALSSNILPLSSVLSTITFKKYMIPLLLKILDNEESMTVQAKFLSGIGSLSTDIDLTNCLNAIKNTVRAVIVRSNANWRARRSVLTTFVEITKFCNADYFSDNFKIYFAALLGDPIFAVRRSATLIVPLLSKHYGIKWSYEHLVPYITMFIRDLRYLYRYVALFGINEMISPSLGCKRTSYLQDLKTIIENEDSKYNKKALRVLNKTVKIFHLIEKELKHPVFSNMLQLKNKLTYTMNLNTSIYEENDFDSLRKKHKNIDFYSVSDRDLEENNWPFVLGVLSLIYNKFLPIIKTFNNDITENVQTCAIFTLGEITDFLSKVNEEICESWVEKDMHTLSHDEIVAINDEIHHEFKNAQLEEEPEVIDTHLMEPHEEKLDLGKTITIQNSNVNLQNELSQNDDGLVKEVLDMFDKKISESLDEDGSKNHPGSVDLKEVLNGKTS